MNHHTFLWHDYETFGTSPKRDRPAQFAAIRTDAELNEVGEPLMIYCQPAPDYLPDPESCLITGILPQLCCEKGVPEHEFAARIETEFTHPDTIGVGYNTLRFDDEFTRYLLWRNLLDPYAREWQNGCGRWDLLDVVRMCYALRPEGLVWPKKGDGTVSFKLEDLTRANGLQHDAAHDALSDVRATIALARLIRQSQPKLFDFAFGLHKKERVMAELGLPSTLQSARPFLHVSGMFPTERGCLGVMWPLTSHPRHKNEVLAWDLAHDPTLLTQLDAEQLRLRLFTKTADLPAGVSRLPVKSLHLNKAPMVVGNLKTLRPDLAQRWGIDLEAAGRNAERAVALPDMSEIWREVFAKPESSTEAAPDPEQDLYGGFVGPADRRRLNQLRTSHPADPDWQKLGFDDERLAELVFLYRARGFPETLTLEETNRWRAHCASRLLQGRGGALTLEKLLERVDGLAELAMEREDEKAEAILGALVDYAESIAPEI